MNYVTMLKGWVVVSVISSYAFYIQGPLEVLTACVISMITITMLGHRRELLPHESPIKVLLALVNMVIVWVGIVLVILSPYYCSDCLSTTIMVSLAVYGFFGFLVSLW